MNKKTLWNTTLERIEISLPSTDFHTFFHNTEIANIEDKNDHFLVEISTPHPFTTQRLREKYQETIQKHLEGVTGTPVKLEFSEKRQTDTQDVDLGPIFHNTIRKEIRKEDESNLNPNYTFENFVIGSNNQLASAVALSVAEEPGSYNPFFLYSGVGLGKTHLMQAIGNQIKEHLGLKVMYCPMETFMNGLVDAIQKRTQAVFKKKYRNVDVLLIDDVQSISGKESTQEELFNTFNSLYMSQKQLVFTSDRPPKDIARLEERLRSRFSAGMIADMQAPDEDVRLAILQAKENQYQHTLNVEIKKLIAESVSSNIRELEGAFQRIVAAEKTQHLKLTLEEAAKILEISQDEKHEQTVTPQQILKTVCEHFNITLKDIKGPSRQKQYVHPRQISMYLMNNLTDLPLMGIGDLLGGRDHTTIIHGLRTIKTRLSENLDNTKQEIHNLQSNLGIFS